MVALGIADDEPDILRLFEIMLKTKRYPIAYMARNGEEAVTKHRANPADIVFMDYCMPYMDGIEATREILKEYPKTKIFLMTCGEDIAEFLGGLDMVTVIKKPFTLKSVLAYIDRTACA